MDTSAPDRENFNENGTKTPEKLGIFERGLDLSFTNMSLILSKHIQIYWVMSCHQYLDTDQVSSLPD